MKGLFIPEITAEMFRSGCLEQIEALMSEGEIYDIEYEPKWIPVAERLPDTKEDGCWFFVTKEKNETHTGSLKREVCVTFFDEFHRRFECSGRTTAWMPIIFPEPYEEVKK